MSSINSISSAISQTAGYSSSSAPEPSQNVAAVPAEAAEPVKRIVHESQESSKDRDDNPQDQKSQAGSNNMENIQEALGNSKTANDEIKKAVDEINKKMISHSEAIFGIHDKTNRVTIKIVDKDTKEVIKELPPEKTLDMLARVWEMAGILVDEKR